MEESLGRLNFTLNSPYSPPPFYPSWREDESRKMDVLSVLKPRFIEGGIKNGHKKNALEKVWNEMEAKGMYAFQLP